MLTIRPRKEGREIVLELGGTLSIGESLQILRQAIEAQVAEGELQLSLDMSNVTHIDSFALGELVSLYTTLRSKSVSLKLTGMTTKTQDLVALTKVGTVLQDPSEGEQEPRGPLVTRIVLGAAILAAAILLYAWLRFT